MPGRMKKECKKFGCHNLTDKANGYCAEHQKELYSYDRNRLIVTSVAMTAVGRNIVNGFWNGIRFALSAVE